MFPSSSMREQLIRGSQNSFNINEIDAYFHKVYSLPKVNCVNDHQPFFLAEYLPDNWYIPTCH